MTQDLDAARGRDIVARWRTLAEQRLEYLTELFETGRWRRFHSELAFLENIQEAKNAVETWRNLATREASRDNSAVDISWLRDNTPAPRRGSRMGEQEQRSERWPVVRAAEPAACDAAIAADTLHVCTDEAPSAPNPDNSARRRIPGPVLREAPEPVLDLAAIQERYPLLRNAL